MDGNEHDQDDGQDEKDVDDQHPVLNDERRNRLRWILGVLQIVFRDSRGDGDGNDGRDNRHDDDADEDDSFGDADHDQRPVGDRAVEAASENVGRAASQIVFCGLRLAR